MRIKKLIIDRFRLLNNLEIPIGEKLTAIVGQNGTGKSSLLGLIGHVFTFNPKSKTINGKQFFTQYSEIFRFSYPNFDKPKEHIYKVELDSGETVPVISYDRINRKGVRVGLRLRVGKSERRSGKKRCPVIYLGLKRLFPLAQENKVKQHSTSDLTGNEINEYERLHNEILILKEKISPEKISTRTKTFYAAKTLKYDALGNSAGQDNVGQILTAYFSFRRLKEQLGSQYEGGLLLIDELDTTLYPAAQIKLIEKLFQISSELNLQIIFTTHSLEIIGKLLGGSYKYQSKVVHLSNAHGSVTVEKDAALPKIINNLRVQASTSSTPEKINVYCEDEEAKYFLVSLLKNKIKREINLIAGKIGCDELLNLATKKIPEFKKSIIVLDGDSRSSVERKRLKNVICLPGRERPENIFHKFLMGLNLDDEFWLGDNGYTQQVCFRDCSQVGDRNEMKKWFKKQLPYWGRCASKIIKRWKKENSVYVSTFEKDFLKVFNRIKPRPADIEG